MERERQGNWLKKIAIGLLFGLPVVFFVVSYFLITVSGEDIFQGAGTAPAVWKDMREAFFHNARIPDMYAWAVINFFDYQFSFGIDTIFRLVDVLLGVVMLVLMARVALGRKLEFKLGDAVIFALGFVMIFLTPHGRVLYAGFSAIHNYLLIAVIALGFSYWYLKAVREGGTDMETDWQKCWWFVGVMLVAGVVFGLSSNLTPIAFLMTWGVVTAVRLIKKKWVRRWEIFGVAGIIIGMGVAYIFGPGVSGYVDSGYATEYDYVSLGELVEKPVESVVKLAKHMVSNFGRVLGPIVIVLSGLAILRMIGRRRGEDKEKIRWLLKDAKMGRLLAILAGFMVIHVAIAVQLNAPIRILLPAYVAGVIVVMILAKEWLIEGAMVKEEEDATKSQKNSLAEWKLNLMSTGLLVVVLGIVGVRTMLAIEYHEKAGRVLEMIRETDEGVVCVMREDVKSRVVPGIYLGQEDMLADWAMPIEVYGREVRWCGE